MTPPQDRTWLDETGDAPWLDEDRGRSHGPALVVPHAAPPVEPDHDPGGWPELLPLDSHPRPPAFPTAALPPWLALWVAAQATALQVPEDMMGMLALGVLAACVQRTMRVRVRDGWDEQPSLYVAIASEPASRKTGAFTPSTAPVRAWELDRAAAMRLEIEQARSVRKALERKRDRAEPEEAAALALEVERSVVPIAPRVVADDVTSEALAVLLAEHGSFAIMAGEGCGLFDLIGGRYRDSGPAFELYLKAHAGDPVSVDRVGRPPIRIDRPRLTIVTTTQPEALRGLARVKGARGLGLLARFAFVTPPNIVGRRISEPPPMSPALARDYDGAVRHLLEIPAADGDHLLVLDPAARDRLVGYMARLEPRLGEGGDLHAIADWAGKLAGLVARIAGVLHVAEFSRDHAPWLRQVSDHCVHAAMTIGDYLLAHALVALDAMAADPEIERTRAVWRRIDASGLESFSKHDLYRMMRGRAEFANASGLDAPLAALVEHGYIRLVEPGPQLGPGRPASPRYVVRPPEKHGRNGHNGSSGHFGHVSKGTP